MYDADKVNSTITAECFGKQTCTFDVKAFIKPDVGPKICTSKLAQFYTQVSCNFSSDELKQRDWINKALTAQVVLSIVITLCYTHHITKSLKSAYNVWDKKVTTIADYTVKATLPPKLYEKFLTDVYKDKANDPNANPIYEFKGYLRDEIAKLINKSNAETSDAPVDPKIVDIEFTFENIFLYDKMKKRANAIIEEDQQKRLKIEREITDSYDGKHIAR